ncbi:hypothetical protein ILYODFUR_019323 [Ilyodon furcidens]|uniref:Uncharacterized protein n=1 Tax=Ilyodon furcidens TaxID=33524 RepID=A0ABV0T102_9TELE
MRILLSSSQTGKTAPLSFVETASLLGTSLEHSLLLQASERNKETLARCLPHPNDHRCGRGRMKQERCFYLDSDVTGSPQLPRFLGVPEVG